MTDLLKPSQEAREAGKGASADADRAAQSNPKAVSSRASIPSAEWLYDLPRKDWNALTNRGYLELPQAKGASAPLIWRGGDVPVPEGTKISIWYPGNRDRFASGYWVPTGSNEKAWRRSLRRDGIVIYRFRNAGDLAVEAPSNAHLTDRIADALERIADLLVQAIETRRAETGTGSVEDESAVPKECAQDTRALANQGEG